MKLIFACICLYLTVFSSVYACINSAVCFNVPHGLGTQSASSTAAAAAAGAGARTGGLAGGVGEAERKIRHRLHHRLLRPQRGHRRLQQHLMSFRLQTNQIINKGQNNHRREYCQATTQLSGTPSHYKIQMGWEHQATTTLKWVGTPSHYKIQVS